MSINISVIIPSYNEEENINELYARIQKIFLKIKNLKTKWLKIFLLEEWQKKVM